MKITYEKNQRKKTNCRDKKEIFKAAGGGIAQLVKTKDIQIL